MSSPVYRMPPLPVKAVLFQQLLTGQHRVELYVGATGEPIFALVLGAERLGVEETRLVSEFLRLVDQSHLDHHGVADISFIQSIHPPQAIFQLQAHLHVDLACYEVLRGDEHIPLRAREAELLRILLRHPRRYVRADVLAEAIGAVGSDETEHPVEQMVSTIRHKLGETPRHPRLIRSKRHAGYAIFPEESAALPRATPLP